MSSPELIGRDDELGALIELVGRARDGHSGVALVAGEAGIGKSRLVAELERRAVEAGALALVGECVDLADGELSYALVVAALRPVVRARTEPELDRVFGPGRSELARLLPELGPAEPTAAGSGGQARLFELLLGVLSRLGQEQPVLLVLEDVHWADAATRDLLVFLARNQRAERLATVMTLRSDELGPEHPLRRVLADLAHAERLDLEPLTRAQLAAQVAAISGAPPSAVLVRRLFERSQGNPFYTEELLASDGEQLPASLRDALLVRVQRLGAQARAAIDIAAVAGRSIDHRLLSAVSSLPERDLTGGLRAAVAHHVLVSDGLRYAFRHALLRDAVYSNLLPGERATLHTALARALGEHPGLAGSRSTVAAEIAHHWSAAGDDERALAASITAGREADGIYAISEAHRHYERALELWPRLADPERLAGVPRSELLRLAADAAEGRGDPARGAELGREALAEPDFRTDPTRSAMLLERIGFYLWVAGDSRAALEAYREAVALMPPDPPTAERAAVLAGEALILRLRGQNEQARARSEEAIGVARTCGARAEEGDGLMVLGWALSYLGDIDGGLARLREAVRIADAASAPGRAAVCRVGLTMSLARAGRAGEALDVALDGVRIARELGLERSYGLILRAHATLAALLLGRIQEADRVAGQALESPQPGSLYEMALLEATERCAIAHGDLDRAESQLGRALAIAWPTGDQTLVGPIAAAATELELWQGRPERALEIVSRALALAPDRECLADTWELYTNGARAHADLAQAARALGDTDAARRCAQAASELGERRADVLRRSFTLGDQPAALQADAARCAAEIARAAGDEDPAPWDAAVAAWDALGYRPHAIYARWRLAEALLARGDRERATTVLTDAALAAAEMGSNRYAASSTHSHGERAYHSTAASSPTTQATLRAGSGSPHASSTSCGCSPTATPTARSPRSCSSPRKPPSTTYHGSSQSSTPPTATRPPQPRTGSASRPSPN